MRVVALSAGALAVLAVAGGLAVLNGNDDRADEDPTAATLAGHRGMGKGTVWIANEGGGSLTAIDAATNRVVTTVAGVEGPHNVQVSPDGASVWTVSGHDGYAAMLSAGSLDLHGMVPTGSAPAHVVVSPDGATVTQRTTTRTTTPDVPPAPSRGLAARLQRSATKSHSSSSSRCPN